MRLKILFLSVFLAQYIFSQENEQSRHSLDLRLGIQITRLQEKNNLRFYNSIPYTERAGGIQYKYILHQESKINIALHTELLGSMKGGYYELPNYGTVLFEQRFTQLNTGLTGTFKNTEKRLGMNLNMGIGIRRNLLFFSSTQSTPVPDFKFKMKYPGIGYTSLSTYYGMEAYWDIFNTSFCTYRGSVYFNFEQDISADTFIFRSYYVGIGLGYVFNKRKTLKN